MDRVKRFDDIVSLLSADGIETEDRFTQMAYERKDLSKLAMIKGIGPKTIDYFKF
jgi:3-methyladenine DNA glycosylase/8-oxoguanine DNA glycosylase